MAARVHETLIGYVQDYELAWTAGRYDAYYYVTISTNLAGDENPRVYGLYWNIALDTEHEISRGNVHQAAIATFKEALIHEKKVEISYVEKDVRGTIVNSPPRLYSVKIFR